MITTTYETSLDFAKKMDQKDPLRKYRDAFYFPQHNGKDCLYFCGNSLGLQPKGALNALQNEMHRWRSYGVEGHFHYVEGDSINGEAGHIPWTEYHKALVPQSAHIVGAKPEEIVIMNTLTVNLHLMMVSFYRPTNKRFKILMEGGAFPSDQYEI